MKTIIKDNEVGYVMKNGIFDHMIMAGTYHFSKLLGYEVITDVIDGEVSFDLLPSKVLTKDDTFVKSTVRFEIPDGFIGYLYKNGKLINSIGSKKELFFWNVFDTYEVKLISMENVIMGEEMTKKLLSVTPLDLYKTIEVKDGEEAVIYYDNIRESVKKAGIYRYWNYTKNVTGNIFDIRPKQIDIVGQEILTKDKIGIRMNVTGIYQITDVINFSEKVSNLKDQLYTVVQLAVREIVGKYKLDEILELKEQISKEIFEEVKKKEDMFFITIISAGIKDIILPGEVKEIMNSVLVAEKIAQANVISRREEVASTRSLLNTAKLMDENQTLYKLKELEYLERICEKVGDISINGNAGILEQLGTLMGNH